jgi:hypothetical protein
MAVTLKQILIGQVTNTVPAGKVWLVKNVRLVNKHATTAATLNVTAGPSGGGRTVSPQNMSLGPGQMYQDDSEFILNPLDILSIIAAPASVPVDYLVSGIERDQS